MKFSGIDYDTHRIDVVHVDLDTLVGEHVRYPLTGPLLAGDAFDRARRIRDVLPPRTWWADNAVALVVIEQPHSAAFKAAAALSRAQGAILACLPPAAEKRVDVWRLSPLEWRSPLGLPVGGKRDVVKGASRAFAIDAGCPSTWPQDAFDAYCIARAAIAMCDDAAHRIVATVEEVIAGGTLESGLDKE